LLRNIDHNDWTLILNVAILALTLAVVVYAQRTLRVTKESLDLFSNPLVTIEGDREIHGPYRGDNAGGGWKIEPRATLTLCNYSPMEIILPPPLAAFRILPEESSEPLRAAHYDAHSVQLWRDKSLPTEPWPVSRTLPLLITLRGPPVAKGAPPLKLVTEFKVPSYLYRGKTYGPLLAICTFLIEAQG
jgi:hypothetical protein